MGHEEGLELDEVFQIERHRGEEDGVAEGAQEGGQPEVLDGKALGDVEIHQQLVHQQDEDAYAKQTGVFSSGEGLGVGLTSACMLTSFNPSVVQSW